ncbi:hypothetical protein MNBD_GAMMA09-2207 [hydrothermal vent metagenome]|uniref:Uncharacterized protein n=1 Tax=hydrothermal vent metagenome TaxID=652676 RepID=A0A3B0XPW3_9ZZZZ
MQNRWSAISNKTLIQLINLKLLSGVFLSLFLPVLLPSCAYQGEPPVNMQASILPVSDSSEMPAVIRDLLSQADQKYMQGDYNGSIATLERAIRIKPRYPEVWSRIAQVYATLGQKQKAISYAERSNGYIDNNPELKALNDRIIRSDEAPVQVDIP